MTRISYCNSTRDRVRKRPQEKNTELRVKIAKINLVRDHLMYLLMFIFISKIPRTSALRTFVKKKHLSRVISRNKIILSNYSRLECRLNM